MQHSFYKRKAKHWRSWNRLSFKSHISEMKWVLLFLGCVCTSRNRTRIRNQINLWCDVHFCLMWTVPKKVEATRSTFSLVPWKNNSAIHFAFSFAFTQSARPIRLKPILDQPLPVSVCAVSVLSLVLFLGSSFSLSSCIYLVTLIHSFVIKYADLQLKNSKNYKLNVVEITSANNFLWVGVKWFYESRNNDTIKAKIFVCILCSQIYKMVIFGITIL